MLQIFDWIRPNGKADVIIKYHILNLNLPNEYSKSICNLFYLAIDDSNFKNLLYKKLDSASVKNFLAADPIRFRYTSILKMKITNKGTPTAKNLKILFPESNFIELENRGKQMLEACNENYIDILELRSDDEFEVTCWGYFDPNLFDNKISASYDGGKAIFEEDKNVFEYSYEPHIPILFRMQIISMIIAAVIASLCFVFIIFTKLQNYYNKRKL